MSLTGGKIPQTLRSRNSRKHGWVPNYWLKRGRPHTNSAWTFTRSCGACSRPTVLHDSNNLTECYKALGVASQDNISCTLTTRSHLARDFEAASIMVSPLPIICVLGSLNIDLVYYTPHHPLPGETLTSSHSDVSPGGKGANQAVACAKLSQISHAGQRKHKSGHGRRSWLRCSRLNATGQPAIIWCRYLRSCSQTRQH